MTDIARSIADHKFNPEIAKKAFAEGIRDENCDAVQQGRYLPVYQKFYDAARKQREAALRPERIRARQEQEELFRALALTIRNGIGDCDRAREILNRQIGL